MTPVPRPSQSARTRMLTVVGVPTVVPSAASTCTVRATSPEPTAWIGTVTLACWWAGTRTVVVRGTRSRLLFETR